MGDLIMMADDEQYNALMERQAFRVDGLASAEWCIRKVREAREAMAENNDYAQLMMAKYREWADKENKRHEATVEAMSMFLAPWVKEQIAEGKKKSVRLPDGTAGYRKTPGRLEIRDENAAIGWCRENAPEALVIKESVSKAVLKEYVEDSGEMPDGVEIMPGEERFYILTEEET